MLARDKPGNTKGGSITVPLTSCLTGLDKSVLQIKTKIVSCHTADSKLGGQQYSDTSPFSIPWTNVPAYSAAELMTKKKTFFNALNNKMLNKQP